MKTLDSYLSFSGVAWQLTIANRKSTKNSTRSRDNRYNFNQSKHTMRVTAHSSRE